MNLVCQNLARQWVLAIREALPKPFLQGLVHRLYIRWLHLGSQIIGLEYRCGKRQLSISLLRPRCLPLTAGARALALRTGRLPSSSCLVANFVAHTSSVAFLSAGLFGGFGRCLGALLVHLLHGGFHGAKRDEDLLIVFCKALRELEASLLCTSAHLHVAQCGVKRDNDIVVLSVVELRGVCFGKSRGV